MVVSVDHRWGDGGDGADLPVVGVGLQEDNAQSEGVNDGTDSVVDIAVRRPEVGRRDTHNKLDHLHLITRYVIRPRTRVGWGTHGVPQFGEGLFAGDGSHVRV